MFGHIWLQEEKKRGCFLSNERIYTQTNELNQHVLSEVGGTDVAAAHLQVDLDDSVKLLLLHVEQEVVLGDACCVHAHRGRLEVARLQTERETA